MGYKKIKDKKEEVINVADMELFDNHPKNIEKTIWYWNFY